MTDLGAEQPDQMTGNGLLVLVLGGDEDAEPPLLVDHVTFREPEFGRLAAAEELDFAGVFLRVDVEFNNFISEVERRFVPAEMWTSSAVGTAVTLNSSTLRPSEILSSTVPFCTLPLDFSCSKIIIGMLITKRVDVFMAVLYIEHAS